mmetsp:Transcript_21371/g.68254  ORF Transcript_21371/g.68254 Transcript_21371/m.68254 type:complete len:236 (+) Transcript_21371:424-1131(+)
MPRTATEASFATGAAPRTPHARAQLLPASPACRHIELVDGAATLRRGRGTLRPTAQPPSRAGAPPPPSLPLRIPLSALRFALRLALLDLCTHHWPPPGPPQPRPALPAQPARHALARRPHRGARARAARALLQGGADPLHDLNAELHHQGGRQKRRAHRRAEELSAWEEERLCYRSRGQEVKLGRRRERPRRRRRTPTHSRRLFRLSESLAARHFCPRGVLGRAPLAIPLSFLYR